MNDLGLPRNLDQSLGEFVESAKSVLESDLVSVVLFGSAAEGKLRATSDVNLILVLAKFDPARIDKLRDPMRGAHALIRLECMLILESEVSAASEAFAVKFADIRERHRVLWGKDLFAELRPSREAMRVRLRQILLNFILRTRERYLLVSLREEQLAPLVADCAGSLRSAAALILDLEGRPAPSPKEALVSLAGEIDGPKYSNALVILSRAREEGTLAPGDGAPTILALIDLAQALRARAEALA